ncbi:unnamed protein product, partial [Rotaria magnacalcarata]
KRQRLDKDDRRNELPIWLKLTNEKFRELFRKISSSLSTTTITVEELQQLVLKMYQDRKYLHEKQLWSTLLKIIEHG